MGSVILLLFVAFCAQLHLLLGPPRQTRKPPGVAKKDIPIVGLACAVPASRVPTSKTHKTVRAEGRKTQKPNRTQSESLPKEGFRIGSKFIKVERFDPSSSGPHPALVMVHGSSGLAVSGFYYRMAARTVANKGFIVFLVHYFDRTGTKSVEKKDVNRKDFLAWKETIREAVLYASRQKGVRQDGIGLLGGSLGDYLAMSVAMDRDLPVRAVAEWFGGMPKEYFSRVKTLPPTLIVHGDCDKVVPVGEARRLTQKLEELHVVHETRIYKGQRHLFSTDPFGKDARDAQNATVRFFQRHLTPPRDVAIAKTKGRPEPVSFRVLSP